MKKFSLLLIFSVFICTAFFLLLVQCGGGNKSTGPSNGAKAKWTILGYMDGNNDLDESQNNTSYVISDIHEMEEVGSTEDVQVVVMLGCEKKGGICKYHHIEKFTSEMPDSVSSPVLEDMGTKDMSDPTSLREFLQYGVEHYPADHYIVIIDDHGGGWRGACWDEQNGAGDMMSLPEMKSALTWNGAPKFDLIVFHACLMSMVEVAYELKGCANYMVACQFTMPMESLLGSEEWLGGLVDTPSMSALDLGKSIVSAVYNAGQNKGKLTHMALTDLSKANALSADIATLGNHLITETGNYWNEVAHAWGETHYTQYDDIAFVDIREFVKKVLQEEHLKDNPLISGDAQDVIDAVNEAVPYTKTNVAGLTRGGLCIHFPYTKTDFDSSNYVKTAFKVTNWHNFLSKFVQSIGGTTGDTGNLSVNSTPQGATVYVDGTQYGQTPVTIQNVAEGDHLVRLILTGYQEWQQTVHVTAGQTAQVNATLIPVGTQHATVSGTATWPGHALSANAIAFLDSSHTEDIYVLASTSINTVTGNYTITLDLQAPMEVFIEAWDNLNGDSIIDLGEGFGFYDANGNGEWDDMIILSPGQQLTGIHITLWTVSGSKLTRNTFK